MIKIFEDIDSDSKNYSFVNKLPNSIKTILFPTTIIEDIEITTEDKVKFIVTMSNINEDTPTNEIYKLVGTLPNDIQKLINPTMNMKVIKKITITLVIIYIISALFNYIEGLSMINVANKYAKKLRTSISKKINKLPLKFFDHNLSGDILSRVTNDVDTIAQSLNQSLSTLVSSVTLFIGSIIMMFVTNWIMALTAILASLIGFVFMFIILGKSQKYFTARQIELGKLNGYIEEVYSGLNVVKTCNGMEESNKKFDELNHKLYNCNRKSQFLSGLMHPIMNFIGNFGYVAVCIVGALLVSKNMITFGVIVAFIMYVRLFTNPLSQIAQAMTSLQTTAAASERVFDFLEEYEMSSQKNIKKILNKDKVKGKIEFQNVKFGYDEDKIIIKNFNATAKPGQKIAIVGPTGAGKTTMVNLLMKFYDINEGDIKIDDTSIKELTRENIHNLFTMVLQDTWLFEGTIKENIIYNRKNISDERVREVCETVGVDHFIKTLPNGYDSIISSSDSISSGQKQLLTIARGMIEDAPFLILDEATSNVDTRTEELVQKAMDKLMKNKTSFIIAHRLSTIKNADLILVMKDGNIIETGNHNELMKENGFYANLYNSQFESIK
ncbi:MAG: ABC transporter ATP-binding protein [Bacilli bacterium]